MKTDSNPESKSNIFQSPANYYNPATKQWESGSFTLNKKHVQFICHTSEKEPLHLCLPLSSLTAIEKRQSSLIYPSLVICIGTEKHWFGSFKSRDAVYNVLELFWRESLLSKPHKPASSKKYVSNSVLGKELLDILHDSENTLIGTANALSDQSRQLSDNEQDVEDINSDLAKAEEAIEILSSHLTFPVFRSDNSEDGEESDKRMHKYKVTFSFSNSEDKVDWEKGTLVISDDLVLVKVDENVIMQVTKDELEAFEVLSPWELRITHTFSDLKKSCFFMCPQLSRLLKFVSSMPSYKDKVIYTDEDSSAYETASCSSRSSFGSARNSPSSPGAQSKSSKKSLDSSQTQLSSLTEEDFRELHNVLENLQTMAAEVCREQENQFERINALSENMEKTELKMKNSSKTAKK